MGPVSNVNPLHYGRSGLIAMQNRYVLMGAGCKPGRVCLIGLAGATAFMIVLLVRSPSSTAGAPDVEVGQPIQPAAPNTAIAGVPVTAVLLHWKRTSNLARCIRSLARLPFVSQLVLWNNNPAVNLTLALLGLRDVQLPFEVTTVNSQHNHKDLAKYMACASAKHDVCFYHDDDFFTEHYAAGLYAGYLAEPGHIHAATEHVTAFVNWAWTFYDVALGLHTGHSWIGCGAIFARAKAEKLLHLLRVSHADQDLTDFADCFFALMQNQFPRV